MAAEIRRRTLREAEFANLTDVRSRIMGHRKSVRAQRSRGNFGNFGTRYQ